ncbi:MAG: response regulator [Treponema sp.]|nr:response regulator [Treponema sp.]
MSRDKKRILVIEDSDIFADMLTDFLFSPEYEIQRAANGLEGIKKVYSFLPHLIITDVEMPIFKGHQVTRVLKSRKNTCAIPIIMFTTLGETRDKFWGMHAGADLYLEKSPDNFKPLQEAVNMMLSLPRNIDFTSIERESSKINDESIIEIINSLLDNKLFQTTIIGKLMEFSDSAYSLEMITKGILDLLRTICEAEIVSIMIRGSKGTLYIYTANFARFSAETAGDFSAFCKSDFDNLFPDFQHKTTTTEFFLPAGNNDKKLASYFTIPLSVGSETFASLHIANSINEYFSPWILENITLFSNSASPIISNALSMRELSELQKNTIAAFARYVPPDAIDEIINSSQKMVKQSENRNITVLFSDIRNFTTISEDADAQDVVEFLNLFFARMGSEIISEGGHIDKFIGDAIMAVFGAFGNTENTTENSIRSAVRMLAALDELNVLGDGLFSKKINIGIGINYGECILGNIGFQNKMDYTIIGDTVNLASRIEALTKNYRHPLIVSEYLYNTVKDSFIFRKVDNVRVIGKQKPVELYAVYTGYEQSTGPISGKIFDLPIVKSLLINRDTLASYNKGLQLFYMREFKPAQEYFTKALETTDNDFLSQVYLQRSVEFAQNPPPSDWDGVVTLAEK